ncbi:hypothetical protein ES705_11067 [subsurface metagenome]
MILIPKLSPSVIYFNVRGACFKRYESNGLDNALDYIRAKKITPNLKAGLKAEILFYDRYKDDLKLEALLDAGVKADFMGIQKGQPVNYDVTTNLKYKDIEDFREVMQKKEKLYTIALVNLRSEEVEFFPLKFPICPKCNYFSHYLLYIYPPDTKFLHFNEMSGIQTIVQFCPYCGFYDEVREFSYHIHTFKKEEELLYTQEVDDQYMHSSKNVKEMVRDRAKREIIYFEKESKLLLSALAEDDYHFTGKNGDGFYFGKLYWSHPLARDLSNSIDISSYDLWDL